MRMFQKVLLLQILVILLNNKHFHSEGFEKFKRRSKKKSDVNEENTNSSKKMNLILRIT